MKGLHYKLEGLSLDPHRPHKIQAESQYWGVVEEVGPFVCPGHGGVGCVPPPS